MIIDPFAVAAVAAGGAAVVLALKAHDQYEDARFWNALFVDETARSRRLQVELLGHKAREIEEMHKRSQIARLGGKAKAAKVQAEATASRDRTNTEIGVTSFRPREEVVAAIRANRAARNQSPAGVAANRR